MGYSELEIKTKHLLLHEIMSWLSKCKNYPEWKQKIIAEHNRWHKLDEQFKSPESKPKGG